MCGFSPSAAMSRPEISPETARAFEELRLAVCRQFEMDPEETTMTICRPRQEERYDDSYFYEQHDF